MSAASANCSSYDPRAIYEANPELHEALTQIASGHFSPQDPERYRVIYDVLVNWGDHYQLLADYADYVATHDRVDALYREPELWVRKAICNVAAMGGFSSDRAIAEYAERIWHTQPIKL